jgi:membrane-associated phospholipid phosphatase
MATERLNARLTSHLIGVLGVLLTLSPRVASADEAGPGSPFAIRLAVDLPVTLGSGVLVLGSELAQSELPGPACGTGCDASQVNILDRISIGSHLRAAQTASDVLVGVNVGLPFVLDFIDVLVSHPADGWRGYGEDALVLAEVLAVNLGLNAVFKYAVRRPRPLVYDPDPTAFTPEERTAADAALSFYSSHSAVSFSLATAYSYLFMRRHPDSPLRIAVWLVSEGLAATTAALRVVAGKHFITDVLTGAAIGGATGVLIPYLHQRALPTGLGAFARDHRFSVSPMAIPGAGLLITVQ